MHGEVKKTRRRHTVHSSKLGQFKKFSTDTLLDKFAIR